MSPGRLRISIEYVDMFHLLLLSYPYVVVKLIIYNQDKIDNYVFLNFKCLTFFNSIRDTGTNLQRIGIPTNHLWV